MVGLVIARTVICRRAVPPLDSSSVSSLWRPVCPPGASPEDIKQQICGAVKTVDSGDGVIVFADLVGGSAQPESPCAPGAHRGPHRGQPAHAAQGQFAAHPSRFAARAGPRTGPLRAAQHHLRHRRAARSGSPSRRADEELTVVRREADLLERVAHQTWGRELNPAAHWPPSPAP